MDPNFYPVHRFLARAYLGRDMHEEAVIDYQKAAILFDENPDLIADFAYA